jgi:hypothetical protein
MQMPASLGVQGPGRQHDAVGLERHRLVHRNLVVAVHGATRPEIAQKVHEVVGETVVVIDQKQHVAPVAVFGLFSGKRRLKERRL